MTRPRFSNSTAWQQAEVLMQPVFIRLIDNIRKELEQSDWQGSYQEEPIWPQGVSPETQEQVRSLQAQLAIAPPEQAAVLEETLAQLPAPFPGYSLCLEHTGKTVTVDLWQLCYQICFTNYHPLVSQADEVMVEVDRSLLDETGDVDWQQLDAKAQRIVHQVFASLMAT